MNEKSDGSERRLQAVLEKADICVWQWNPVTGKVTGSPRCEKFLGLNAGEFPPTYPALLALVSAEDRLDLERAIDHSRSTGEDWQLDYRVVHPDGSIHRLNSTGSFFFDESGGAIETIALTRQLPPDPPAENKEQERLWNALTNALDGISFLDRDGRYREVNRAYADILGYRPEEMIGMNWRSTVHPDDRERVEKIYHRTFAEDKAETEVKGLRKDGSPFYKQVTMITARDHLDRAIGHYCFTKDISTAKNLEAERAQIEENLRATSARLQYLLSATPAVIFTCRVEGNYGLTYISDNVETLLGYPPDQFVLDADFWLYIAHPDDREQILAESASIFATGYLLREFRYRHAKGYYVWVYEELRLVRDENGQPIEIVGYMVDIDDRVRMETRLKNSLAEKELLLREIHHRIKNNLHVVANLLDLQSDYIEDPRVLDLFAENQNRIHSMALIYEQLYQSHNPHRIEMGQYLDRLVKDLGCAYCESRPNIEIVVDVEPLWLNLETAVPCGLLVNELVTNALRHAFDEGRSGRLQIRLARYTGERLQLSVSDNGIGLPPELDWQKSPTLGMRLIRILSKQLKAEVTLENPAGTTFTVIFRQLSYQTRF